MNKDLEIKIPFTSEQRELTDKMTHAIRDSSIKAVCFKLFSTLALLPFSDSYDIFLLMEKEFPEVKTNKRTFSELRIDAEIEAKKKFTEKCSVRIEEIYEILAKKAKIGSDVRDRLVKRERELFVSLVFPRNFGRKLFETARTYDKKTVIIADTIYPREDIVRILGMTGYSECSELIISNEIVSGENRNETLFELAVKKSKTPYKNFMNIGGDVAADIELPIIKGAKALLVSEPDANMIKSGRLRGFVQARRVFNFDTGECLGMHLALGIYSAYIFDFPRTKTVHSDFCGNPYILGFIVYGCCRFADLSVIDEAGRKLLTAIEDNEEMRRGGEDFEKLFRRHFGDHLSKISFDGFDLPLELLTLHGDAMDVGMLKNSMSADEHKKWKSSITDAPAAPISKRKTEQNSLEKLADKMFPPGTKVRNIADGLLFKMKGGGR